MTVSVEQNHWWSRFAVTEVDTDVLNEALLYVRNRSNNDFAQIEDCEQHPAILLLTSWWNNGPGKGLIPAAYFEAYQRVGESVKRPFLRGASDLAGITADPKLATATAFVPENIFFVFCATQKTDTTRDGDLDIRYVNNAGRVYSEGAVDEAYYSLYALKRISEGEAIGFLDSTRGRD
jgi:hypothetical protein